MTSSAATIWNTLSSINVNDHVEKKQGFSYLSWAWAWGTLMKHYPNSYFDFLQTEDGKEYFAAPDGTVEVRCILTVDDGVDKIRREMWLPVMDHKNAAIKNPNSRDLNDAKMRCLVKAMALFGLGHYIYAGEDLPSEDKQRPAEEKKPEVGSQELIDSISSAGTIDELKAAFSKAARYAKNRGDEDLLAMLTTAKDIRKEQL